MSKGLILIILIVAVVSFNATAAVRAYAKKRLIDTPNERSSHTVPTPRGGGLAIVIAFFIGLAVLWVNGTVAGSAALALAGGFLVAGIGFMDDRNHVSARLRFGIHAVAAIWAVAWLGGIPPMPIGAGVWEPGFLGAAIGVIGLMWLINLTNFMDGIDGLAASQAIFISLAGGVLLAASGAHGDAALCFVMAAAVSGFLIFNWPPASLFMGDVGSGFLGLALGTVAIAASDAVSLWAWGILFGPFMADATVTRAVRGLRYGDWFGAHRAHVYQRRAREWGGHLPVVQALWGLNMVFVLPAAIAAQVMPGRGWAIFAFVWAVLFVGAWQDGAGRNDDDAPAAT